MTSQTPTGYNYGENGGTSDTFHRSKIHVLTAFYSGIRIDHLALIEPTPRSAVFMFNDLAEFINPDMCSNVQLDPTQLTEESCDLSQYCQPPQTEHAQYHTPSDTMSSPDGSVGQLTPSPKTKAKSIPKQRPSNLSKEYIPTPTTETHNIVEIPDDTNDNSASHMSAEAMSMAGKELQTFNKQANSGVKTTHTKPGTFTKGRDQSKMGPHCAQNLGYQNGQPAYNPHAPFYPLNQPINTGHMTGPIPSNFGSANSIAHIYPHHQIPVIDLEPDNVNIFDANSMVASAASKVRRTVPTAQLNPQKQTPKIGFKAHNAKSNSQRQTSSSSSQMMPKNGPPMKAPKEAASQHPQKAGYFERLLSAMNDLEHAEDNAGMVDSWEKKMNTSQMRIQQVCMELVEKAVQAQECSPRPLSDDGKPPTKILNSLEERIEKLESVLATQKTICKHLLEESYINRVVTDPEHAQNMVENNRRVNFQKKQDKLELDGIRGVESCGKGYPVRKVRKPGKQQEESGDECQGTSGNTNNSPETQGSNQGRARSAAKRPHRDVGHEDSVPASIKVSPSKRARKNAHSRTKSASALNIDMAAASPLNAGGAPRTSAHQHSNSYPGVQPMSGARATFVDTPKSGLPHTIASPYNNTGYNQLLESFQLSAESDGSFYRFNSVPATPDNPFAMYTQGNDMDCNLQSAQADN
ncbi:MAG: hypothetical protein OHK93_005748 [Ramalina farinacea]|uniref:Uncharacterized protein n=1 Tax=Ramalina farinacea TaxID=258253 RepID=A0AA43QIS0_9LECA|nr:hypothetical protein [Ramalina farinacea]